MMPTRLQDGLSIALLQWIRTVESNQTRSVIVRISDSESLSQIIHNLLNAGLTDIQIISDSTLKGTATAESLTRIVRCLGVCSVASDERE